MVSLLPWVKSMGPFQVLRNLDQGIRTRLSGGAMLDPCDSRTLVRGQIFTRISQVIASYSMKTISSASYERIIQEIMTV